MTEGSLLWEPSAERTERATITRFMRWVEETRERRFDDYDDLWRWSVEDLDDFWRAIWEFFDVRSHGDVGARAGRRVDARAPLVPGRAAELRRARVPRQALRRSVAVVHASELRELGEWTWARAARATARLAAGLRALGVGAATASSPTCRTSPRRSPRSWPCASLGAIWSSCSPDFGARSVVDRFAQIEPKVLLAVDGYRYGGRDFDRRDVVARAAGRDASLRAHRRAALPRPGARPRRARRTR